MVRLNSLEKEANKLAKINPLLAAYIKNKFIKIVQREFLLLQNLPGEIRIKIIQYAHEYYSVQISAIPDEMMELDIARIMDHESGWLWRHFGFFSKTMEDLLYPKFPLDERGVDSCLWIAFWQVQSMKLDFFEEEFPSVYDVTDSEDHTETGDFLLLSNWSNGMDKETRTNIISFHDWGQVLYTSSPIRENKTYPLSRVDLLEKVKKGFLENRIEYPAAKKKSEPVKNKDLLKIKAPVPQEETKYIVSLDDTLKQIQTQLHQLLRENKQKAPAGKLSKASEWMDPIVEEILRIESPVPKEVKDVFERHHPGFNSAYQAEKKSKFADGEKLKPTPVSEALAFLFNIREKPKTITARSIFDKYKDMGKW